MRLLVLLAASSQLALAQLALAPSIQTPEQPRTVVSAVDGHLATHTKSKTASAAAAASAKKAPLTSKAQVTTMDHGAQLRAPVPPLAARAKGKTKRTAP